MKFSKINTNLSLSLNNYSQKILLTNQELKIKDFALQILLGLIEYLKYW